MTEVLEVGPHPHQWVMTLTGAGVGVEECTVCHTRRVATPIFSGVGGDSVQATPPDLPEDAEVMRSGPPVATDSATGLPPQAFHAAEPPEDEDAPTVAQVGSSADGSKMPDEAESHSSSAADDIRSMKKYEMVEYARSYGVDIDESMLREDLAEDIIQKRGLA